jgi:hypothetical protein
MAAIGACLRNNEASEITMNIDKRWFLLLVVAASAAAGAAIAVTSRRGHHRSVRDMEHKTAVKSWENEGGNLAPIPATAAVS